MALIVTDNSVRQINAALLSLEKKIGETNSEKAQDKQVVQMELKNIQYDFMAPLYQSGNSVSINTTGTWEGNARSATTAEHAITADNAEHADTATSADTATTATTATNATTAETANKVKNALTVNGKTYDGSSAVNAGVQTVANGGTGATTANAAANSFINSLTIGDSVPVDNDYYVSQYVNGGTNTTTYHRRPVSKLWEYIKGKISSVLGLTATNYGGKASTADTSTNADHATNANITKTTDTVNGDKLQIGSGTAQNVTNAKHAATADNAANAEHAITADNGVPTYSTSDAGKNLAVNSSGNAVGWVKPQTIKFVDYRTGELTFSSLTDQKKIELSNFGPEVTENNVLSFMTIYWRGIPIIAQGDWAKSQGTGSSGLSCSLYSLNTGTGFAVIRCVYLA